MKRIVSNFLFMVVFANAVLSQINTMRIYKEDGSVVSIPLTQIDSVKHVVDFSPTIDGYTYQTVTVGSQVWFAENLRTKKYSNGNIIPNSLSSGGWVWYNNDSTYENLYGKMYDWYAVADTRNICPTGWHVPSDNEWDTLINFLGGYLNASNQLKSTSGWYEEGNGTNSSGLNFLPGGGTGMGIFGGLGVVGRWWSSTENEFGFAWSRHFFYNDEFRQEADKTYGYSVRCIMD